MITIQEDRDTFIDRIEATVRTTCSEMFKQYTLQTKYRKGKSVPWWSTELTIMRKRTNALRRRYQRTQLNEELPTSQKPVHRGEKEVPKENLWNEVYRLAAGKTRETLTLTTLLKPDSSRTTNIDEILKNMMDYLIPEDYTRDDTKQHENTRRIANQPIHTPKDQEFSLNEVRQTKASNPEKRRDLPESHGKF
jgi:hypothetical protein